MWRRDGAQPLVITGYTRLTLNEYAHNLPDINEQNPLILNPGEEFTFRVNFRSYKVGNFLDSIVFQTWDNLKCDNICLLDGKVISIGLMSQDHDWEKVRINYSKQPTNIYEPKDSELITAINTSSGEFGSNLTIGNIVFEGVKGPAGTNNGLDGFSFDSVFKNSLPLNPFNFFKNRGIYVGEKSEQRKVYFRPTTVGEFEINYYFQSNAEVAGKETRYVIKGHGIVPNLYLYQDDNAIEITDIVDFGTIENNIPQESVTERLIIANYPTNMDDGDVLTINSINWGARTTTNISNLGTMNNEFYVNESKMFEDLGQSGYPITLGIGESVDVEVTYFTKNNDTEHRSDFTILSDADESGQSGKFNNTITLLGNAKSSSVINKQITSNFYPNPANNTITFDKSIKGNIEIYNLLGKKSP